MREAGGFPTIWSFCFGGGWRLEGGGGEPAGLGVDGGSALFLLPQPTPQTPLPLSIRVHVLRGPDRRPLARSYYTSACPALHG